MQRLLASLDFAICHKKIIVGCFCLTHILLGMLGLRNSLNIPLKEHTKERQQHVHVACVEAWHTCPKKMTQPKASSHFAIRGTDVPQSDDADMLAAHVKT